VELDHVLLAVVDPAAAANSSFGRWVASRASHPGRPLGWAVRTSGLDTIVRRLNLPRAQRRASGSER
jgi:hypothetical protein